MARRRRLAEASVVVVGPAEFVQHRPDEQRRVGDAAGHRHRRPGRQRVAHRVGAEIGVRRRHPRQDRLQRLPRLQRPQPAPRRDQVAYVVAQQHRAARVREPRLRRQRRRPPARRQRVRRPHVRHHPHAAPDAGRQHRAQTLLQPGAGPVVLAAPHGEGFAGDGPLSQTFERQVIDLAALRELHRRLPAVAGEPRAAADAKTLLHRRPPYPVRPARRDIGRIAPVDSPGGDAHVPLPP